MRSGIVLLRPPALQEADLLYANLRAKGILVLQCSQEDVKEQPGKIADFLAQNRLDTVVVSNLTRTPPPDRLRYALEEVGLGRLSVAWVELAALLGEQMSGDSADSAQMTILANLVRLQHADYVRSAIQRIVPRASKISRRDLFRSVPEMLRVESDIPVVLTNQCRGRSKSCDYCRKACPVNAVSQTGDTVMINDRLCIECGACARDCPIGAIQPPSISDAQLIAMLNTMASEKSQSEKRALLLTCPIGFDRLLSESAKNKHLESGIVPVQIPCVASIGSAHHLWSASLGVALVTVCPDISCKNFVATFPMYKHLISSKNLLKTLREDRATMAHHLSLNATDPIVDNVSQAVGFTIPVDTSVKLSEGLRQEVTVNVIGTLACNGSGEKTTFEDSMLPLFDLKVDETRCTLCEFCQRHCPDHAIEFAKNEDSMNLMFDPSVCGGCMICERNCPEKAITISRLRDVSPVLERKKVAKASDANARCENCGETLGSKQSLAVLKKRLAEQGATEASLKAMDLCMTCRQKALIQPLA